MRDDDESSSPGRYPGFRSSCAPWQFYQGSGGTRHDSSGCELDDADVGIRSGNGRWPGMIAHKIFGADFTPMLSPALAASIGGVNSPEDLLKLPIVDPSDPWWKLWFEAADITALDFRGDPRSRFGDQHLEGKAVIAGQGVGILTPMFYVSELKQGLLLQPFDIVGTTDHFYWLVYPEARRNLPKIRAFRDWLLSQLKSD